jgi:hypothetical protein
MIMYSDEDMIKKATLLTYFLVRSPADGKA